MKKYLGVAAVAVALSAAPAMAEDFSGPYIGTGVTLDNVQGSGSLEGFGASGVGGTVFAGYDLPIGDKGFAGLEGNVDASTADVFGLDVDWTWGVSGRIGYKLNDSTGLYTRVGYARTRISGFGGNVWGDSVRYGLGLQTGLTDKLSLRAEVSQYNYESDLLNNQAQLSVSYGF